MKAKIILGDVRTALRKIEEASVQTVITSPPYWGLRDYGTASYEGGDPNCEHSISMNTKWNDPKRGTDVLRPEVSNRGKSSDACHKCGATRTDSQLGLEPKPEDYVENMVGVFREIWRVLRDDGTVWLNLGDTYSAQRWSGNGAGQPMNKMKDGHRDINPVKESGLPDKNLVGIPWRVALALQADGWYLRQDIIWNKPNPMPESVADRCTKSHEYVFLLTKSPKYFFDNEAIKEIATGYDGRKDTLLKGSPKYADKQLVPNQSGQSFASTPHERWKFVDGVPMRNKRSVWTINTKPFKGAHFAVMPEALVEPCLLAGIPQGGCCSICRTPYVRDIKKGERTKLDRREHTLNVIPGRDKISKLQSVAMESVPKEFLGWIQNCKCEGSEPAPSLALDPFTGSGTVAVVALRNNCNFVGTELNPEYVKIAEKRIIDSAPLFNEVEIEG